MELENYLKKILKGEVLGDAASVNKFSGDASLFEVKPKIVVAPRDSEDIKKLVKFVVDNKRQDPSLSLTARSAGTDMTGGPLGESIIIDFLPHFNWLGPIGDDGMITAAPGVFYRDFEKVTLTKNYILPSYPASRELCAIGGIINNNSGGERSLVYGKTENYVSRLKVVLSDGREYVIEKLNKEKLDAKMKQIDFEGGIYRAVFGLLESNYKLVKGAKPQVSKNSVGYNIWDVWNRGTGEFDLTKLFIGSQGTLGIMTEATLTLVKTKKSSHMVVIFLKNLDGLPLLITEILKYKPTSLESFDDHTLKLSIRFLPGLLKLMGFKNLFSLLLSFLPDAFEVIRIGVPKLVVLVEFEGDGEEELIQKSRELRDTIKKMGFDSRITRDAEDEKKYWTIRRESFNLLRHKVIGKQTAPYIDDLIVKPEFLSEFLPKLYEILDRYKLLYTIAGHVGDGNFHIIPLMDLKDENERAKILPSMKEVYDLVFEYHGSISAEHNDGLMRGPYIQKMFGDDVYKIFKDIKKIFDPQNIFNPHKKTDSSQEFSQAHIKRPV
ncbi:MAG: FAD-binding oxidoreductase [Candidatus Vogelbacteria bacterium]|nr:FAD-binding oxidoreductase [Candidatus Vogelbacteria bacterium]